MRVLHVISSISAARGGSSAAVWSMLEALRSRGIVADLVTTDDDGVGRVPGVVHGRFRAINDQPVCMFPRQTSFYAASLPMQRWLSAHVAEYDVVHAHGLFSFAPVAAALAARRRAVPYIVCPHGVLNRWGREHARPRLKRLSIALVERRILESADRVHFTSASEQRQAEELGLPLRAAVVPLALRVNADVVAMPSYGGLLRDLEDAPRTGKMSAAPQVLFVGRIAPIKRVGLLIEAFARVASSHANATLVVAGTGPEPLVDALRRRAEALGIAARVRWPGFVDAAARDRLLESSTLFVLPSESENFGLSAAEAMAAGLPVVLSAGVGISEEVAAAGAGLVCGETAESLGHCLQMLLSDPGLRQRMGSAGRRLVAEQMSLPALGRRLERLYGIAFQS